MNARHRGLCLLLVLCAWKSAPGQTPAPAPAPAAVPARTAAPAPDSAANTRIRDPYLPSYSSRYRPPSRTAPVRTYQDPDADYGFRNPGGVGRMNEYYPPGNTFERGPAPTQAAQFDIGPSATSRSAQLAAQQVGIQRSRMLNEQIEAYSTPRFGYGFGFGGYGAAFPH